MEEKSLLGRLILERNGQREEYGYTCPSDRSDMIKTLLFSAYERLHLSLEGATFISFTVEVCPLQEDPA